MQLIQWGVGAVASRRGGLQHAGSLPNAGLASSSVGLRWREWLHAADTVGCLGLLLVAWGGTRQCGAWGDMGDGPGSLSRQRQGAVLSQCEVLVCDHFDKSLNLSSPVVY